MAEPFTAKAIAMALGTDITKRPVQHKTASVLIIAAPFMDQFLDLLQLLVG